MLKGETRSRLGRSGIGQRRSRRNRKKIKRKSKERDRKGGRKAEAAVQAGTGIEEGTTPEGGTTPHPRKRAIGAKTDMKEIEVALATVVTIAKTVARFLKIRGDAPARETESIPVEPSLIVPDRVIDGALRHEGNKLYDRIIGLELTS